MDFLQELFNVQDAPSLGPERRSTALSRAEVEQKCTAAASKAGLSPSGLDLLRSAMLLWHDHLDASHSLSQEIHSTSGSLLHAIMHRREPDYGNSKYWWRRVGDHSSFAPLASKAGTILEGHKLHSRLLRHGKWDPFAFVDAVEAAAAGKEDAKLLKRLQAAEMEAFLEGLE